MDQVSSSMGIWEARDGPSLYVYTWEKGKIGFTELHTSLLKFFNHSVNDCLL